MLRAETEIGDGAKVRPFRKSTEGSLVLLLESWPEAEIAAAACRASAVCIRAWLASSASDGRAASERVSNRAPSRRTGGGEPTTMDAADRGAAGIAHAALEPDESNPTDDVLGLSQGSEME